MKKYHAYSYPIMDSVPSLLFRLDKKKQEKQEKQEKQRKRGGLQKSRDSCHSVLSSLRHDFQFPQMIRQYTFTCEQDFIDVTEGYCPRYAVYWLDEQNRSHWPEGTLIRHRPEYLKLKEETGKETEEEVRSVSSPLSETNRVLHKNVRFDLFREIIPIFDDDDDDSYDDDSWDE